MSQLPRDVRGSGKHAFWLSGIGGFVLGALTVIIVLLLARKATDRKEPGPEARPTLPAAQNDAAANAVAE